MTEYAKIIWMLVQYNHKTIICSDNKSERLLNYDNRGHINHPINI